MLRVLGLLVLMLGCVVGCSDGSDSPADSQGPFEVSTDDQGNVTALALRLEMPALAAAIEGGETWRVEELVPSVVAEQTFVQHVEVEYVPHGHGPPGVNDIAHFDFHFYGVAPEAVASISCAEQPVPPPERVPPGYDASAVGEEPNGACVPGMGVHAVRPESMGRVLDAELVLGYDQGALVFIEPMVAASRAPMRSASRSAARWGRAP